MVEFGKKEIDLTDVLPGGKSKAERYKWLEPGQKGELRVIHKSLLSVDDSYQRSPRESKVHAILHGFSWPAFGALTVAQRPSGSLVIIDGQHRWMAAMKHSEIADVPVVIFKMSSASDEASEFINSNTLRKPVTALEKFKAQIESGDRVAIDVKALVEAHGRRVGVNSASTVGCIALMYRLMSGDRATLTRVWPLIVSVCDGHVINERIVDALVYIEKNLPAGVSVTDRRWSERIKSIGYAELLRSAIAYAQVHAKGGAKAWARGIVERVNRGLQERNYLRLNNGIGAREAA